MPDYLLLLPGFALPARGSPPEDRDAAFELRDGTGKRISLIQSQITALADHTHDWLEQSSNLLKLANQAKELFLEATSEQKKQLLDFVSSNRVLTDRKLGYVYNKPFELARKIQTSHMQNAQALPERSTWRGILDEVRTVVLASAMPT